MNVEYGFSMVDVMTRHFNGSFQEVDIDRLRDFQDLTLMWLDLLNERIATEKLPSSARLYLGEDVRLFSRIADEIGAILTAEFFTR
ncbi:hypothetical protein ACFPMF_01865 [Larkinella bovis]|uniref:Acyl carrier protein n=1 Tax=Larkinella bovis TaxID=683041 RepID=A0ABW0I605_9BACT